MQNIVGKRIAQISVTPTISSNPAYSANDQVGGIQTLSLPTGVTFTSVRVRSVTVVDAAKQSAALNLYFFSALPTVASSDNAALNITAANMAACRGTLSIPAAGYITSTAVTVGGTASTDLGRYLVPAAASAIYVVAQTTGTPQYTTVSDLVFHYEIELHY